MPRVLIPSDNPDFARYLAHAYARADWEVALGTANFDLSTARYDRLHLQWPEELCGWRPPPERRLVEILARLDEWKAAGTELVLTVHNLRPHRNSADPRYQRLLDGVYQRVGIVLHFTKTSRDLVVREFPASGQAEHVVTGFFNLSHLVPGAERRDPAAARRKHGFAPGDFVFLVFGGLREWEETELLRRAYDAANVSRKRLLISGSYDEPGPVWRQRIRRWRWRRWLRSRRAVVIAGYTPDDEVYATADAADAVVLPRRSALNSGLPALGASFGKIIVAPDCGAYPELLAGTLNPMYTAGDAVDLARKLEYAAKLDQQAVADQNTALAEKWSWTNLIGPNPGAAPHRD